MELPICLTEQEENVAAKLRHFAKYFAKICELTIKDKQNTVIDGKEVKMSSTTPTQIGGMVVGGIFGGGLGFFAKSPWAGMNGGQKIGAEIAKYFENIKDWNSQLQVLKALLKSEQDYKFVYANIIQAGIEMFCSYEQPILNVIKNENWVLILEAIAFDITMRFFDSLINTPLLTAELLTTEFILKCILNSRIYKLYKSCNMPKIPFKDEIWTLHRLDIGVGLVYLGDTNIYFKKDSRTCDFGFRRLFDWESKHDFLNNNRYNIIPPEKPYSYIFTKNMALIEEKFILRSREKECDLIMKQNIYDMKQDVHYMKLDMYDVKKDLREININVTKLANEEITKPRSKLNFFNVLKPVATFTGRKDLLVEIHEKLQMHKDSVVISQSLTISGLGGIGKSETSRKYAWDFRDFYEDNIRWISAENKQSLLDSFIDIAVKLKIPVEGINDKQNINENKKHMKEIGTFVQSVYNFLEGRKCLFIFDNAESLEEINCFLPKCSDSKDFYFLITSRSQHWNNGDAGKFDVVIVNEFSPDEAFEYIKLALGLREDDSSNDELKLLTKRLEYYPLALSHATSYIQENKFSGSQEKVSKEDIDYYLERFETETEMLLKFKSETKSDHYENTIHATLNISLEKIKENKICGKESLELIHAMSYMAPDDIQLTEHLRNVIFDERLLWKSIKLLEKYSLIKVCKTNVSIHRILQKVVRFNLMECDQEFSTLTKVTDLISKQIFRTSKNFTTIWSYAVHYEEIFNQFFHLVEENCNQKYLLHMFVDNGYYKATRELLSCMSKLNYDVQKRVNLSKESSEETPLHIASARGYADIAKLLVVTYKADANKIDSSGRTPLMRAIIGGYDKIVNILAKREEMELALRFCRIFHNIKSNKLSEVEKIFNESCTPTNFDKFGLKPVMYAAYLGHLEIIKFFLHKEFNAEETNIKKLSPLMSACKNAHIEVVKYLIDECGANVSHSNSEGSTALLLASINGNLEVVKFLVSKGSCITEQNVYGNTALLLASYYGHLEVVKFLLEEGSSVAVINVNGDTPMTMATASGKLELVELLLNSGGSLENINGKSPLLIACIGGNLDIVEYLLNKGASLNDQSRSMDTPLLKAALNNYITVVDKLLEKGSCLTEVNEFGNDCLLLACINGYLKLAEYLVKRETSIEIKNLDGTTPLLMTCICGHFTVLKFLLEKGANLMERDFSGSTALLLAAKNGNLSILKFLLKNGCSADDVNTNEDTALILASMNGHLHIVKYLIEIGCSIHIPSSHGITPFLIACKKGHLNVVLFLLEKGALLEDMDNDGNNALALASIRGSIELIENLLNKGCKLLPNFDGETPLIKAASFDNLPVVKFLIENGASAKECDKDGDTPLLYACMNGHLNVIEYLLFHADSSIKEANCYGNTPLLLAALNGHIEAVKFLLTKTESFVQERNKFGNTALLFAALRCRIEVMEYLFSAGATISEMNEDGETAILRAAFYEKIESMQFLVNKGANVQDVDKYGNSCLSLVCFSNNLAAVQYVISEGADKNHANFAGNTPLMHACMKGNLDVVKYLISIDVNAELKNNREDTAFFLACAYIHMDVVKFFLSIGYDINQLSDDLKGALDIQLADKTT